MEDFANWIDSYNSSWTREDLYLILNSGGTQYLFEKLIANGEVEGSIHLNSGQPQQKPTRKLTRWKVFDSGGKKPPVTLMPRSLSLDSGFHFKDSLDLEDFENMTSGMLEMQIKLSKQLLNQSELVTLIRQKIQVFNRLTHAYRALYQRKIIKSPHREMNFDVLQSSNRNSIDLSIENRVGTQALVELGLTTGLPWIFNTF